MQFTHVHFIQLYWVCMQVCKLYLIHMYDKTMIMISPVHNLKPVPWRKEGLYVVCGDIFIHIIMSSKIVTRTHWGVQQYTVYDMAVHVVATAPSAGDVSDILPHIRGN